MCSAVGASGVSIDGMSSSYLSSGINVNDASSGNKDARCCRSQMGGSDQVFVNSFRVLVVKLKRYIVTPLSFRVSVILYWPLD
jgi:hypothetical protein